jgi:4'-phosphopantetheinyl transferase
MIHVTFVPGLPGAPAWAPIVLDPEEHARWSQLHEAGRPLFLAAHVGVRMLASYRLAMADATGPMPSAAPELEEFGWKTLPSGKPTLTYRDGRPQPLHVSVAHGGGFAAAAVCDHGPIGIDLEHVDPQRRLLPIARRFYAPDEHARLEQCGPDERTALFHQWWTRKEAVLKATGVGLRGGLTVRVDGAPDDHGWREVHLDGHATPLYVRDLCTPDPTIVAAIAIEGQPGAVQQVGVPTKPAGGDGPR